MSSQHKAPLAAFFVVSIACIVVVVNALRSDALAGMFVAPTQAVVAGTRLVPAPQDILSAEAKIVTHAKVALSVAHEVVRQPGHHLAAAPTAATPAKPSKLSKPSKHHRALHASVAEADAGAVAAAPAPIEAAPIAPIKKPAATAPTSPTKPPVVTIKQPVKQPVKQPSAPINAPAPAPAGTSTLDYDAIRKHLREYSIAASQPVQPLVQAAPPKAPAPTAPSYSVSTSAGSYGQLSIGSGSTGSYSLSWGERR